MLQKEQALTSWEGSLPIAQGTVEDDFQEIGIFLSLIGLRVRSNFWYWFTTYDKKNYTKFNKNLW